MTDRPAIPIGFDAVRELFDRALLEPRGLKITRETRAGAFSLRAKLNKFRLHDRKANKEIYAPGHMLHNHSLYDGFELRIPPPGNADETCLYIERPSILDYIVESLPPHPEK